MLVIVISIILCGLSNGAPWNTWRNMVNRKQENRQYLPPVASIGSKSAEMNLLGNPALNSLSGANYIPQVMYNGPRAFSPGYDENGAPLPVQDTPEVANAKAIQLAKLAEAGGATSPSVGLDQYIYESPEEEIASSIAHEAAVNKAKNEIESAVYYQTQQVYSYAPTMKYLGPIALPAGYDETGAPLPVQDTPEVANAKALHLAILAGAGGDINPSYGPDQSLPETPQEQAAAKYAHDAAVKKSEAEIAEAVNRQIQLIYSYAPTMKYLGILALPPGYYQNGAPLPVQDTPEVARAKAQQLAILSEAGGDIYPSVQQVQPIYESPEEEAASRYVHETAVSKAAAEIANAVYQQIREITKNGPTLKYTGPIVTPPSFGTPTSSYNNPKVIDMNEKQSGSSGKTGGYLPPAESSPEMPQNVDQKVNLNSTNIETTTRSESMVTSNNLPKTSTDTSNKYLPPQ